MTDITPAPLAYTTIAKPYGGIRDVRGTTWIVGCCIALAAGATLPFAASLFFGSGLVLVGSVAFQALVVGIGLLVLFDRLPMRKRRGLCVLAALTLVASAIFAHITLYAHDVFNVALAIENDRWGSALYDFLSGRAFQIHSLFVPNTLRGFGLINNFVWRMHRIPSFSVLVGVHVLLLLFAGYISLKAAKKHDWCERCEGLLANPKNLIVLPAWASGQLAATVKEEDIRDAVELSRVGATASLGNSCVIARLLHCPTCNHRVVDVVAKTFGGGASNVQLVGPLAVSDELINALQSTPVLSVQETASEQARDD